MEERVVPEQIGSLPVRERGLKPLLGIHTLLLQLSLPVRERGLKRPFPGPSRPSPPSLPVRERGLKLSTVTRFFRRLRRSPCGSVD